MKHPTCTLLCALFLGLPASALAEEPAPQPPLVSRLSFAPLPLQIFMQAGQKPAAVFTTPCVQIEKASNGFPPFLAFEQFMFEMVGKINDSEMLPVRLEPVCI